MKDSTVLVLGMNEKELIIHECGITNKNDGLPAYITAINKTLGTRIEIFLTDSQILKIINVLTEIILPEE